MKLLLADLLFVLMMVGMAAAAENDASGPSRYVRIGHFQGICQQGDFDANLKKVLKGLQLASEAKLDIVSFPESFLKKERTDVRRRGLCRRRIRRTDANPGVERSLADLRSALQLRLESGEALPDGAERPYRSCRRERCLFLAGQQCRTGQKTAGLRL